MAAMTTTREYARRDHSWARQALVERLHEKGIRNTQVLEAIGSIEREQFVDEALQMRAYEDCALPIGQGQTLSQPFIVARMTELLLQGLSYQSRVLEVGTGSGYQAAVLSRCVQQVFTVERISSFLNQARQRHRVLGLHNIRYLHTDGFKGWPSQAPFDGILVTAAPERIPETLTDQLAIGGRLIIPVGAQGEPQRLAVVTREGDGCRTQWFDMVSFVPMLPGEVA